VARVASPDFLAWRATAAEWYVLMMATAPVALAVLLALSSIGVDHLRHLLFGHLFPSSTTNR
jgi:hypothetical protein